MALPSAGASAGTVRAGRIFGWVAVLALAAACSDGLDDPTRRFVPATTMSSRPSNDAAAVAPGEAGHRVGSDGAAGDGRGGAEGSASDAVAADDAAGAAAPGSAPALDAGSERAVGGGAGSGGDGGTPGGDDAGSGQFAGSAGAASGHPSWLEPFLTGPIAPLTGSLTTDLGLADRRALAVKVGNGDSKDRPQAGLGAADVVFDTLVESGITRLIAVFHSEIPSRIGPVRSVRSSDFGILEDLSTPYLASSGANAVVRREMRASARAGTLIDVGAWTTTVPYARDQSRQAPHNLYFHYDRLGDGDPASLPGGVPDDPPTALFEYGSSNPPALADAAGVTVGYRSLTGSEASHVWDSVLGGWVRIQGGDLHRTETGSGLAEIAPANVVVLEMTYGRSEADRRSPKAVSHGAGRALVLTAGSVHEAVWERTVDRAGYRFTDAAGSPLTLSSGSTWLLLANTSERWPQAEVTVLPASDAARMLADARAAAERD